MVHVVRMKTESSLVPRRGEDLEERLIEGLKRCNRKE